jgi:hypothetical protein
MARRKRSGSVIKTFTSKGRAAPGTLGSSKVTPLGHFDTSTGRVYQHPRIPKEQLGGGNVRITNPAASLRRGVARTASLGMRGVGSVGRVRDVGAPGEVPGGETFPG